MRSLRFVWDLGFGPTHSISRAFWERIAPHLDGIYIQGQPHILRYIMNMRVSDQPLLIDRKGVPLPVLFALPSNRVHLCVIASSPREVVRFKKNDVFLTLVHDVQSKEATPSPLSTSITCLSEPSLLTSLAPESVWYSPDSLAFRVHSVECQDHQKVVIKWSVCQDCILPSFLPLSLFPKDFQLPSFNIDDLCLPFEDFLSACDIFIVPSQSRCALPFPDLYQYLRDQGFKGQIWKEWSGELNFSSPDPLVEGWVLNRTEYCHRENFPFLESRLLAQLRSQSQPIWVRSHFMNHFMRYEYCSRSEVSEIVDVLSEPQISGLIVSGLWSQYGFSEHIFQIMDQTIKLWDRCFVPPSQNEKPDSFLNRVCHHPLIKRVYLQSDTPWSYSLLQFWRNMIPSHLKLYVDEQDPMLIRWMHTQTRLESGVPSEFVTEGSLLVKVRYHEVLSVHIYGVVP